jgi:hypothetical protein
MGERLICTVGGSNTAFVAFHKDTGKELWRALDTREIGYAPPVIYHPAFAHRRAYVHNGQELICISLAAMNLPATTPEPGA